MIVRGAMRAREREMVTTKLLTADDHLHMSEDAPYKLMGESLRDVTPTSRRWRLHVDEHHFGAAYEAKTGFMLDTVLAPDFALI
jgi:hypothetical protein